MDYSNFNTLQIEINDGVALMTFVNSLSAKMKTELRDVFPVMRHDPDIRVLVMTGEGESFMKGGDRPTETTKKIVSEMQSNPELVASFMECTRETIWNLIEFDKPLIAAVNGPAAGEGCSTALASDFIIASEKATFSDRHIKSGITAGDGGVLFWPMLIGMPKAKLYLLTSDTVNAADAERLGLITKVARHVELMPETMVLARRFASGPSFAIRSTKRALQQWYKVFATTSFDASPWLEFASIVGPEGREGMTARMEGRSPNWPRH